MAPVGRTDGDQFTLRIDRSGPTDLWFARYSLWNEDRVDPFDARADSTNVPGFGVLVSG